MSRTPSRPVVVELLGLPGAGKSTLGDALSVAVPGLRRADGATAPGVPVPVRLARKGFATAATLARRPGLSTALLVALARSQGPGAALGRWVHWQQTQALLRRAAAPGGDPAAVRLLDEGALQCLWSAGLRGDVGPLLARLDAAPGGWARGDVVVVLDVPVTVVAERLQGRSSRHSRTQLLAPDARRAELERGQALVEVLVAWCAAPGRPRVVRVDGTGTPQEAAVAVAAALAAGS